MSCLVAHSYLILCDPVNCSLPGSFVHGISQARILEWVTISFSNAWKWKVKVRSLSHVRLLAIPWIVASQAPPSMGFFQARVLEWGDIASSRLNYEGSPNLVNDHKKKLKTLSSSISVWLWPRNSSLTRISADKPLNLSHLHNILLLLLLSYHSLMNKDTEVNWLQIKARPRT